MGQQAWQRWEPAPAGRSPLPPGLWRTAGGGEALHGVWGRAEPDGTETLVVVNHGHVQIGWHVPQQPWRAHGPLVRPSNCALAQVPWLWRDERRVYATDPSDVAIGLVLDGRKPAGLADTTDASLARRWQQAAQAAGLAVTSSAMRIEDGAKPTGVWFVQVAVRGTVAERLDLEAVHADYAACLDPAQLAEVEQTLDRISGAEIAELAADDDLTTALTPGELARTGLVLGYHPATTAGMILGLGGYSLADDPDGLTYDRVCAHVATLAGLPDLPTSLDRGRPVGLGALDTHAAPDTAREEFGA